MILKPSTVWRFLQEGCNAAEVAAFAEVPLRVGQAMCDQAIHRAASDFSSPISTAKVQTASAICAHPLEG